MDHQRNASDREDHGRAACPPVESPIAASIGDGARRSAVAWLLAVVVLVAAIAGGCSGADDDSGETAAEEGAAAAIDEFGGGDEGSADDEVTSDQGDFTVAEGGAEAPADEPDAREESADEGGDATAASEEPIGTGGGVGALQPTDIGRDIVFTATIDVEVDDVVVAGREALTVVETLGGLLFGQETSVGERPRTVLTFKVDPSRFQEAVDRLGGVGVLTDQVITADDVTERIVDLRSRIVTAEASVERLRTFLESATQLDGVARLENELLQRETDLELLRGRLRTLENQVDLATIVVTLTQRVPGPAVSLERTFLDGADDLDRCPGDDTLDVDEGDAVTVCFVVTNEGDTRLADIEVDDDRFDLEPEDLTVVSGSLDQPLEPGAVLVLATTIEALPGRGGGAGVTARPVDAAGEPIGTDRVSARADGVLDVREDTSLPGFGDALGAGWRALAVVATVVMLALAVSLPFLWIPVLVAAAWWWRRRRGPAETGVETAASNSTHPG